MESKCIPQTHFVQGIFSVFCGITYVLISELNHTNKGEMTVPGNLYPSPFPMAMPAAKVLTKVERSAVICGRCVLL